MIKIIRNGLRLLSVTAIGASMGLHAAPTNTQSREKTVQPLNFFSTSVGNKAERESRERLKANEEKTEKEKKPTTTDASEQKVESTSAKKAPAKETAAATTDQETTKATSSEDELLAAETSNTTTATQLDKQAESELLAASTDDESADFEQDLADQSSDDIFATEEAIKPGTDENIIKQLINNSKFGLTYLFSYFPFKPDGKPDAITYQNVGTFDFESQAHIFKPLVFVVNGYATAVNQADVQRGVFTAPENNEQIAKFIDARELYLKYSGKKFDVLLGKAFINNGLADPASITNVFNTSNRIGFQNVVSMGDWQARFDYFINSRNNVSFIVMPFENKLSELPNNSRWLGSTNIDLGQNLLGANAVTNPTTPVDLILPINNLIPPFTRKYRNAAPKNWAYMFRYSGNRPGWDYFFSEYYGPGIYSVTAFNPQQYVFVNQNPDAFITTAGASIASGNMNIFGEALYQYTLNGKDVNFLQNLIGIEYRDSDFAEKIHFKEITPVVEVTHETITRKQTAPNFFLSSEILHIYANDVLLGLIMQKTDKIAGVFGFDYDYKHDDFNYFAGATYNRTDNLSFRLIWTAYQGQPVNLIESDQGLYGLWRDNDNLSFQVSYKF